MMLSNNKFERMVLFEAYNAGEILKTTANRKEPLIRNYCAKI